MLKKGIRSIFIFSVLIHNCFRYVDSACERSLSILAAEDTCWSSKVKIADRIQYTTKSVLNFAKEKLGLVKDEPFHPQQCDYYECIFAELKMLTPNGYPNYNKIVEWIDNNIIYNYAKTQYDTLKECNAALSQSVESDTYFSGDLTPINEGPHSLQNNCEVVREFMKCLALNDTEVRSKIISASYLYIHEEQIKTTVAVLVRPIRIILGFNSKSTGMGR